VAALRWLAGGQLALLAQEVASREALWWRAAWVLTALAGLWTAFRLRGRLLALAVLWSPLWLRGLFEASPGVVDGLLLLLALWCRRPAGRALALGLLLASSRFGPLAAAFVLLEIAWQREARGRLETLTAWLGAWVVGALLQPSLLLRPGVWLAERGWSLELLGLAGPLPEGFLAPEPAGSLLWRGLGPGVLGLALAGLLPRLRDWRAPGNAASLGLVLALGVGLLWGVPGREEALTLLPVLAVLAADGGSLVWKRVRGAAKARRREVLRVALGLLTLLPFLPGSAAEARRWSRPSGAWATLRWMETNLPRGSWVVLDPTAPRIPSAWLDPDSARVEILRIPWHPYRPDLYRGAFWLGWYLPFDYLVVSARTLTPLFDRPEGYRDIFDFYVQALAGLKEEAVFGGPGWRDPRISVLALPDSSLGEGYAHRLQQGPEQGLQPEFLVLLGGALAQRGRAEEALSVLLRARALGDTSPALYANLGALYLQRGALRDAAQVLQEGLERWPEHPVLLRNLAVAYARRQLWRRAANTYARLVRRAPWDTEALLELAAALYRDGRRAQARRALEDYLRRVPPERRPRKAGELARALGSSGETP
jgi:tetratricopeptide (TPR) repeat protein